MDKFEQKLRNYYQYHDEYQPEAISDDLIQRLKALEASLEASKKPRRRYVMPVAAAIALAIGLGAVWAYQHAVQPKDAPPQSTGVTLEDQSGQNTDPQAVTASPTLPETPDAKTPSVPKPQGDTVTEGSVSMTKPEQGYTAQPGSDDPASAQTDGSAPSAPVWKPHDRPGVTVPQIHDDTTPAKPEDPPPAEPDDPTPAKPEDPTPAKPNDPAPAEPDDPNPSEPDDPKPQKPDEPDQPGTEDLDPPEITPPEEQTPDVPPVPPEINVVYLYESGRETLVLTLLSTGEIEEIDVTGLLPFYPQMPEDPDPWNPPLQPAIQIKYSGECCAFGWEISYTLTRSNNGTVKAEVTGLRQMEQAEKGENDET